LRISSWIGFDSIDKSNHLRCKYYDNDVNGHNVETENTYSHKEEVEVSVVSLSNTITNLTLNVLEQLVREWKERERRERKRERERKEVSANTYSWTMMIKCFYY
jgi:hypothetical protein